MFSNCSGKFLKTNNQSTLLNDRFFKINEGSDSLNASNNSKFCADKNFRPKDQLTIQKEQRRKSTGHIRFISDAPFVEINLNNSFYSRKLNVQDQYDKNFKKIFSKSMNHISISNFELKNTNLIRKFSLSSHYLVENPKSTKISKHLSIFRKVRSFDDLIVFSKKNGNENQQSNYYQSFSPVNSFKKSHQESNFPKAFKSNNIFSPRETFNTEKPLSNSYTNDKVIEYSSQIPNLDNVKYSNHSEVSSLHRSYISPEILIDQFKNIGIINDQTNYHTNSSLRKNSLLTDQETTFDQNYNNVQIYLENSQQEKSILHENLNNQNIDHTDSKMFNAKNSEKSDFTVNFIYRDPIINTTSQQIDLLNNDSLNLSEINSLKNGNQNTPIKNIFNDSLFGDLQIQMSHNEKDQQIIVKILKARNLIPKDANGYSDPFVKVYLLPGREQENKRRTKHILKNLNPEWNCTVVYENVYREELKNKTLEFTIWDWDRFKSNDFLGIVKIDLIDTAVLNDKPTWYKIQNPKFVTENSNHDLIRMKESKSATYSLKRKSLNKKHK